MNPQILIVEDEPSIADNISFALEREGFLYQWANTISRGRELFAEQNWDLLILDIGLPDGNGFDFCRELRQTSQVPIIFLTARNDEVDRIVGLEMGADDYVLKPFSPRELVARVRAILRRCSHQEPTQNSPSDQQKGLFINPESFEVFWNQEAITLSAHEFRLLNALAQSPGRIFSRRQLLEIAWEDPLAAMERTVDAHVKSLRAKLKKVVQKDLIITHRGFGYSLDSTQ